MVVPPFEGTPCLGSQIGNCIVSAARSNYHRIAEAKRKEIASPLLDLDVEDEEESAVEESPKPHLTIPVRRVGYNDIVELGPWLLPRLRSIWATVPDATWASKIRSWIMMNDASFIRTDNVVGLSLAIRDDMDGLIRVYERFVLCNKTYKELERDDQLYNEMLSIYRAMKDWARLKNARRFQVLEHSDLDAPRMKKFFGWNLVVRQSTYIRFSDQ